MSTCTRRDCSEVVAAFSVKSSSNNGDTKSSACYNKASKYPVLVRGHSKAGTSKKGEDADPTKHLT